MPTVIVPSPQPDIDTITTITDDVTGALLERIVAYTNGVVSSMTFDPNTLPIRRIIEDLNDVKPWSSIVTNYAYSLDISQRIHTADDGIVTTKSYIGEASWLTTHLLIEDAQDVRSFQTSERFYDGAGTHLQSVHLLDDGRIQVRGDAEDNLLQGSEADEIFNGLGGADTILFDQNFGHDTVYGFNVADDKIDLTAFGVTQLSDLGGMIQQMGTTTEIDLGGGNSIQLKQVDSTDLVDANFVTGAAGFEDGVRLGYSYLLPDIDSVVKAKEIVLGDGPETVLHPSSPRRNVEIEDDQIVITFNHNVPYATFSGGYTGIRVRDDFGQLAEIVGAEVNETESTGILPINPYQPERPVIPEVTYDEDTIWVNFSSVNQGAGTVVIDVDFI